MATATAPNVRGQDAALGTAVVVSWAAVGAVVVVSLVLQVLDVDWSGLQVLLVVVGLLVSLPHGAVDHLVPRWRPAGRTPPLVPLVVAYAALAAVAWVLLRSFPLVGLAVLLTMSVVHFGLGEATFHAQRRGPERAGPVTGPVVGLVTGLVAVVLPILVNAAEAAPYLRAMVPGSDGRLGPGAEGVAVAVVLTTAAGTVLAAALRGQRLVAAEVLLLVLLALTAPPAVAVATYIGWWHAVRHTAVLVVEERAVTGPGALPSLVRRAAAPTAAATLTLGALWWWADGDALTFVSEQIWLLAALTVPHMLVVAWLDRTRPAAAADGGSGLLLGAAAPSQPDPR